MEQELEGMQGNEMDEGQKPCEQSSRQEESPQPESAEQQQKAEQPEAAAERQEEAGQPEAAAEKQEEAEQQETATKQQEETKQPESVEQQREAGQQETADQPQEPEEILNLFKNVEAEQERIKNLLLRLDRRFDAEILNAQNRDTQVRAFYNELQEYKAGLVEKYMKNVLYDIADMRESIKKQAKRLKDRGQDSISLEEFLEYGEDLKSILEKYEVSIYHGQTGVPIDALHQKIARKVETKEEALGKTVAESLSDGYEYNKKVIYPEKISVYVYKPGEKKEEQ